MAILVNNEYDRITKVVTDYDNGVTVVYSNIYPNANDRELEKSAIDYYHDFCKKIQQLFQEKLAEIRFQVEKIQPYESITNHQAFLNEHSDIKTLLESYDSLRQEGLELKKRIFNEKIDANLLKFRDVWIACGLNSVLTNAKIKKSEKSVTLPKLKLDKAEIYREIKNLYSCQIKDC